MSKKMVIIIILGVILVSCGCITTNDNNNNENNNGNQDFYEEISIDIKCTDNTNYIFLIPLIIDRNEIYLDFQKNLTDKLGNSVIKIENYKNELMLNISGMGNSEYIAKKEIEGMYEEFFHYSLTMLNNSSSVDGYFNFKYYFNSDNISSIILEFNFQAKSKLSDRNIQFKIENPKSGQWNVGTGFGGGSSD